MHSKIINRPRKGWIVWAFFVCRHLEKSIPNCKNRSILSQIAINVSKTNTYSIGWNHSSITLDTGHVATLFPHEIHSKSDGSWSDADNRRSAQQLSHCGPLTFAARTSIKTLSFIAEKSTPVYYSMSSTIQPLLINHRCTLAIRNFKFNENNGTIYCTDFFQGHRMASAAVGECLH